METNYKQKTENRSRKQKTENRKQKKKQITEKTNIRKKHRKQKKENRNQKSGNSIQNTYCVFCMLALQPGCKGKIPQTNLINEETGIKENNQNSKKKENSLEVEIKLTLSHTALGSDTFISKFLIYLFLYLSL